MTIRLNKIETGEKNGLRLNRHYLSLMALKVRKNSDENQDYNYSGINNVLYK